MKKDIETDLISVIVPIFNVEAYLRPCIESILASTYTTLQIILVNDGSIPEKFAMNIPGKTPALK